MGLFVHSAAAKPKTGGVLLAIKDDLVDSDSIRWNALVPGRLLHVCCVKGKQALDFLVVYQQVKTRGDSAAIRVNLRPRRPM